MQEQAHDRNRIHDDQTQVKMHENEIHIDAARVKRLLAEQFPHLANRPITIVRSTGTVNAVYRVGNDLCVRLPRKTTWAANIEDEWQWLPKLAPSISLKIPTAVARGTPTDWYPCPWAIYRWIDGSPYRDDRIGDERQAADDLANFILELRTVDTTSAPRGGRRPLNDLDEQTRSTIESLRGILDIDAVSAAWMQALEASPWHGNPVWIHADLLRSNLLVQDGRLCAVIDFGGVGIGDPAADVVPAWSVFNSVGRKIFRQVLEVDDDTWSRARGYALHQAIMIMPYYAKTNPEFVAMAKRTVGEIVTELD